MDLKIAEEVSQLLKKKIVLEDDLAKLLSKSHSFKIGMRYESTMLFGHRSSIEYLSINSNKEFINKLKYLTILEIQNQIENITNEIKSLKYY